MDTGANPTWILEGDDEALLQISGTGNRTLAFIDEPDYETPGDANGDNVYEVTVVVTDGQGTPPGRGTRQVRIEVTNIEEDGEVTLSSEQPHLDEAITATLTDGDIPLIEDVVVAWQWSRSTSSASGAAYTDIAGATSATYLPRSSYVDGADTDTDPDNDTGFFLRATATYTDDATLAAGGAASAPVTDTENGTSEDSVLSTPSVNSPPEFPAASAARMVNENAPATTAVGDPVMADDSDRGDSLEYTMSGADASSFEINEDSGQITVGMGTMLDYEGTKQSYSVMVTVEDAAGATDSVMVTINVVDMNEVQSDPEQSFGMTISGSTTQEYAENGMSALSGAYRAVGATGAVTWSLTGADAEDFTFNSATGELSFAVSPDFEMPADDNTNNAYEITLNATSGLDVDDLSVTVTVTNMDEDGTVTLDMATPQVGEAITATLGGPGRQHNRHDVAVGQFKRHGRSLYRHQRRDKRGLHSDGYRRRYVPAGDGDVHRRPRRGQGDGGNDRRGGSDDGQCAGEVRRRWRRLHPEDRVLGGFGPLHRRRP